MRPAQSKPGLSELKARRTSSVCPRLTPKSQSQSRAEGPQFCGDLSEPGNSLLVREHSTLLSKPIAHDQSHHHANRIRPSNQRRRLSGEGCHLHLCRLRRRPVRHEAVAKPKESWYIEALWVDSNQFVLLTPGQLLLKEKPSLGGNRKTSETSGPNALLSIAPQRTGLEPRGTNV